MMLPRSVTAGRFPWRLSLLAVAGLGWAGGAPAQYGAAPPGFGMPGQTQPGMPNGMPNRIQGGGQPPGMPGQVPPGMGGGFGGMGQAFPQQQPGFGGAPGGMPGQPGQFGAAQPFNPQSAMGNPLAALEAYERQDFGVPPSTMLHGGAMHAPTPTQVPGGQVITTAQLVQMVQGGMRPVIVDVLGSQQSLPGAIPAPMGGAGGSFQDGNQAQFVGLLQQATGGDPSRPLVIYCLNPQCWLSYNATLRAVNAGFRQVLWYRGGIESWAQAGLPLMAAGQQPGFGAGGMPGAPAMPGMAAPGFTGAGPGGGFGGQGGKPPPR